MILGLTGSFAAGKGTVVDYLVEKKGFSHYSTSGVIREEIVARGLPLERDSYITVGNELRAQFGPTHLVDVCYARAQEAGGNAVIESLRAVAEVREIKKLGGVVVGVDADPHIRYERALTRASEKDNVPFEKWVAQEQAESNPEDETKQDIFGALQESDYVLTNNTSLEELQKQIENILSTITK